MELMRNLATEYENSGDGDQAKTYRFLYYITKSSMLKLQEETETKRKMKILDAAHRHTIKKTNLPQTNSGKIIKFCEHQINNYYMMILIRIYALVLTLQMFQGQRVLCQSRCGPVLRRQSSLRSGG